MFGVRPSVIFSLCGSKGGHVNISWNFIADSLEGKSHFQGFMEISDYNMPFDVENQIELDYVLKDKIITVSNYTLDFNEEYYFYVYKADGEFLTIQNKPLTSTSFECNIDQEFISLKVIGTKRDDMKNIKTNKLIPGAYAGIQALIQKNRELEKKNTDLVNKMCELEMQLNLLMAHIKL